MTKAIIYKDDLSEAVFCVDGKMYFKNNNSRFHVEAHEILNSLKLIKIKGITKRKELIEKMLNMKYDEAAKFHLNNQISEGRIGKLFEGEFNDK